MTAVVCALLAACCFAVSSVLQHRAASAAPEGGPLRLVLRLLRDRRWLLGVVAGVAGFGLQVLAVRNGPVVVVQPLLTAGLVPALGLAALTGRPPGRAQWLAAGGAAVGLAVFLVGASPARGADTAHGSALGIGTAVALGVCAAASLAARRPGARYRALVLGSAAGVGLGVTGALLKQVAGTPVGALAGSWALYALLVLGGVSVLLAQEAFAAGELALSLPALTVLEPVAAVVVGAPAFGETLLGAAPARLAQVVGIVLVVTSVVRLAAAQAAEERPNDVVPAPAARV